MEEYGINYLRGQAAIYHRSLFSRCWDYRWVLYLFRSFTLSAFSVLPVVRLFHVSLKVNEALHDLALSRFLSAFFSYQSSPGLLHSRYNISVLQTCQTCSHPRAFACAIHSAWNTLSLGLCWFLLVIFEFQLKYPFLRENLPAHLVTIGLPLCILSHFSILVSS